MNNFFSDIESYFIDFDSMSDKEIGAYYLKKYTSAFNSKYAKNYTLDNLLSLAAGDYAKGKIFLDGYGFAIRTTNASDSQVTESFDNLLSNFIGNIPPANTFFNYLSEVTSGVSTTGEKIVSTYEETKNIVNNTVKAASNVLSNTVGSIDFITKYLPVIIVLALGLFIYRTTKK